MRATHVNHDQSITFSFNHPSVGTVEVAGTFSEWERIPMTLTDHGTWAYQTPPLEPGEYHYKFVIEGTWISDPVNLRRDDTSSNSVIMIGTTHGQVLHRQFFSAALGCSKNYVIYLPPSYPFEPDRHYPTLYLMGGLFDYELSWIKDGDAIAIADQAMGQKKIDNMIIVMPDKDNQSFSDGDWDRYSDYLVKDVPTHCEADYRCEACQGKRAIEGLSLGAGWALRIGVNHPDHFCSISALSGGMPEDVSTALRDNIALVKKYGVRFRFFCGDQEDSLIPHLEETTRWLTRLGLTCEFYKDEGIHRWPLWQRGLRHSLLFHDYSFHKSGY